MDSENNHNNNGDIPQPPQPPIPPGGGYSVPYNPPNDDQAVLALILGIVSLTACAPAGPFAWYIGAKSRDRIKRSNGALGGEQLATAGFICGIIGTVLLAFSCIWFGIWLFFASSAGFFSFL